MVRARWRADLDGDGDFDFLVGRSPGELVYLPSHAREVFADGFESGDTSAWTLTVPGT